jgi:hypothetical protein
MQNVRRISRWLVENDPTWEKSIDSNLANLSWIKKGTNVKAVCSATSMFCDIVDESKENVGLTDMSNNFINHRKLDTVDTSDITRYLSSRYLNPTFDSPIDLDIKRNSLYKMRKF